MPLSPLHTQKHKTNLAILAALAVWMVLIWALTMVKIAGL
jgi:hypothetical protein